MFPLLLNLTKFTLIPSEFKPIAVGDAAGKICFSIIADRKVRPLPQ